MILIHRRDELRAEKILVGRVAGKVKLGNICMISNTVLEEVVGEDDPVTGAVVKTCQIGRLI